MSDQMDHAQERFRQGFNCSQSVLSAFAGRYGLPLELAYKIAAPFGGGMSRMGEVCGAVTGALMVIGLQAGHTTADDKIQKERVYQLSRELLDRFKEKNGSILCRDLLGYDLSAAQGLEMARQQGLFNTVCPRMVGDCVAILEDLLDEPN